MFPLWFDSLLPLGIHISEPHNTTAFLKRSGHIIAVCPCMALFGDYPDPSGLRNKNFPFERFNVSTYGRTVVYGRGLSTFQNESTTPLSQVYKAKDIRYIRFHTFVASLLIRPFCHPLAFR